MKDFANRLWGASIVLYIHYAFSDADMSIKFLSSAIFIYFLIFGTSRFEDKQYRKII